MSYYWTVAISLSIFFPAIVGLFRFNNLSRAYFPFVLCIWIGFITECINVILAHTISNNWISTNIYLLLEGLLYTWQFRRWGLYTRFISFYYGLQSFTVIAWFTQVVIIGGIDMPSQYFLIIAAMIIVLQSISQMNVVIMREKGNLLRSPIFLICGAFALYFTLRVVMNVSWLYGDKVNAEFAAYIMMALNYVNLLANIVFAIAILWIPVKLRFSLPS